MELWIVRHGQSTANVKRVLAGQLPGELTELGIQQAFITGKKLEKVKFVSAYVSDLNRAVQTFNEIKKSLIYGESMEVIMEPLVREKNGGWLQDKPYDLLEKIVKENNIPVREYRPEGGESWLDLHKRGDGFLRKIVDRYLKFSLSVIPVEGENSLNTEEKIKSNEVLDDNDVTKVMMVSHGQFVHEFYNVLETWLTGKEPDENKHISSNCSLHIFSFFCKNSKGKCNEKTCTKGDYSCIDIKIIAENDISHLDSPELHTSPDKN